MDKRRVDLRLHWADVAERADVTTETLRQVRRGSQDIRALTRAAIEEGLQWERGSIDAILAGGDPTPLSEPEPVVETPTLAPDPYVQRLAVLGLDNDDRAMIERLLADPEWAGAGRALVELGEKRGTDALKTGLDDVREELGEQRRQRQRTIDRITRMLGMAVGRS